MPCHTKIQKLVVPSSVPIIENQEAAVRKKKYHVAHNEEKKAKYIARHEANREEQLLCKKSISLHKTHKKMPAIMISHAESCRELF